MKRLTVRETYEHLHSLIMGIETFKFEGMCSSKEEYDEKLDKARRKANIYAIKNTWQSYNSFANEIKSS